MIELPVRPECFEFAMEFLGGPEDEIIREYVEELEKLVIDKDPPEVKNEQ